MSLILLIGDRHSGKTSTCRRLAELMRARGVSVGGIVAPAVYQAGRCVGYDVTDLITGRATRLATVDGPGAERVGRFHFLAEGLTLGRAALERAVKLPHRLVIVDEVGPLELTGRGWAPHLDQLQVAERWNVSPHSLHNLAGEADAVVNTLIKSIET